MPAELYEKDEYLRLKDSLRLDLLRIDQELIEHPTNLQNAAEACAGAIRLRDALDHELSIAKAVAAKLLRNGSDPKLSEAAITSQLPLNKDVKKSEDAYNDAKMDAAVWQALVKAFEEKGSNMRRVCEMMMAGYLSPTSVYEENRAKMREGRGPVSREKSGAPT